MKIPHPNVQQFFVDLLFFPQKICTFSPTLNECNFWGTWPELCVEVCYSLSMSVCLDIWTRVGQHGKHVHDIDWSWMKHFLNPTLSIVWWSSIIYRELNFIKTTTMKETWLHFPTFEFGLKWFIWFEINNDLQFPFSTISNMWPASWWATCKSFLSFLLSRSLKCALYKLHSIDRIFQPKVCHSPESAQEEELRDFATICPCCQVAAWYFWWTLAFMLPIFPWRRTYS